MKASLFGLGYVGCVTAACLAKCGHEIWGVDINADKVGMINAGKSPIIENGLEELILEGNRNGRFRATSDVNEVAQYRYISYMCRNAKQWQWQPGPESRQSSDGANRQSSPRQAVPHKELYICYNGADCFALASDREGWPNVILESLACGTPVVATDI